MDATRKAAHSRTEETPLDADARLLAAIRAGDRDAGRRFVQEQYPRVYRYLLYLTGRPDQAEDLTQETFLQAWRRLGTFQGRAPLNAWLHTIAHRVFLLRARVGRDPALLPSLLSRTGSVTDRPGVEAQRGPAGR